MSFLSEPLETRVLLSIDLGGLLLPTPGADAPAVYADNTPVESPAPSGLLAAATAVAPAHVDAVAVRQELVRFVDTWNGGQQGKLGTGGMGAYATNWDGLFRMNLDREFKRFVNTFTDDMTIIAQSRAIYINVEAYRNAPAADQARFRNAVQKGADYLLAKAVDPNVYFGQPGGMWWGLQPDGVSPPTHGTHIGGTHPRHKHAYGQVQSLFALAHAYSVTGDADHLAGAFRQLDVWNAHFADTAAGPGAFLQTANENYTQRGGERNLDYMTHALEALLTLDEITPASHPRKAELAWQVTDIGNFITTRMYRDAPGSTTMGFLPWYYDAQWNPSSLPEHRFSTPGHNFEVAFLLSRAVERGFNPAWLNVANKLVAYTLKFSFDNVPTSPSYGAVPHEELAFDGSRFDSAANDLVWWQSSEAARTLLHFASVRGRTDLWDEYEAASAFIRNHFVDPVYGGWYQYLVPTTLAPRTTVKGTVWTGGYHEAMLEAERIRLAPPADVATLSPAADAYVRDGTSAGQNFGTAGDLVVKRSANLGNTREAYVRFDLTGLGDVGDATLRLFGKSSTSSQNIGVAAYAASNTSWQETSLTWNTRPAVAGAALDIETVAGTTGKWYAFDVSAYLRQQKAAGATAVTFALRASATTDAQALFTSGESAANAPQLVVEKPAQQEQAIVVSATSVTVPEGGSASFTVRLAAPPQGDVTVNVDRQSGDADLTGGGSLLFTPANWNTPQSAAIAAAADADTLDGTATFAVTSPGLATHTVIATEADDDRTETTVTLPAADDAHIRDGTSAGQNFGSSAELQLKKAGTGYNREAYLKFDLSGVGNVASGMLRVYGRIDSSTETPTVSVYPAANTSWTEGGLTWNNRPATGVTALASVKLVAGGANARYYEFDVTDYLRAEKAAGRNAVTLVMRVLTATTPHLIFASDEAAANKPQLVVTSDATVPPSLVVSASNVSVPEGGTAQFTVKLAAAPAQDVMVDVARASGDADIVVTSGATLTFTSANWDTPQAVILTAAQDADSTNGSALIQASSAGLPTKSVTATEADDDAVAAPVTLGAVADAFVRSGTYASTNFGGDATLSVKNHSAAGYAREAYLRFDLTGAPAAIGSATLRLFGRLTEMVSGGLVTQVYGVGNTTWGENSITWNNRPAPSTGVLANKTVVGTAGAWYEIDLTSYLRQQKSAGAGAVTLLLRNAVSSAAQSWFNSEEATSNEPELVLGP